ncbi:hypothetical protein RUM44_011951 [Polyplax serrata]|uniref:EF-hand domain-containing protein n=1 Tax=Polyplax serrata TaxID=468196 RepID=A0ABR1BED2_POLSC
MEVEDPYEQYLLSVFESCDDFYQGSLSAAGLQQLCEKLQLSDSCGQLTKCLLGEFETKRVLFHEFRDGLLKLLDGMKCDSKTDGELSPGREAPPTYVFGKKKYERRSRPESNDNESNSSDSLLERQQGQLYSCSTDDSSSEEAVPKKRRTRGSKRKDKKFSKTGKSELITEVQHGTGTPNEVEQLITTAWSNISRGVRDSLKSEDLVKVFQCVGLERGSEEVGRSFHCTVCFRDNKAAQCVFEKLGFEENGRITLQELLEFIKSGGSWSKDTRSQPMELEPAQKNVTTDFADSSILGYITGAGLVEHWECAGVPGAPQLLQNLGYSPTQQIDLSSLLSLLSEEIKGLNEEMKNTRRTMDPHLALLRANSVLQFLYIQSLKTMMEHTDAEKEKLRNDVLEANQRALLLAQEVDDHHSKLEHSAQQQVKSLEQKHAERMRELTNQAKSEQEALLTQNIALEKRLKQLESEEAKNKAAIVQLELEGKLLEQENQSVIEQLSAMQMTKQKLEKDLENVSALQQKVSEMESAMNENDVVSLLERIRTLEKENTDLRDRNDELSVEVEELSKKLSNASIKKRTNSMVNQSMEESLGGGGMKRRGDSFVPTDSAEESGGEEGSPRLGKVRKCSHVKDFVETTSSFQELQINGSGGGDTVEDESTTSGQRDLAEEMDERKYEIRYKVVPVFGEFVKVGVEPVVKSQVIVNLWNDSALQKLEEKVAQYDKNLAGDIMAAFVELSKKSGGVKQDSEISLETRCKELEASLELLREEYEKTEDYWSEKLEEERVYFEEEQKLSDKKYSELLDKILDYEELLNSEKGQRQRLETIEEKDNFEKQMTDMEQECAELRYQLEETKKMKDEEIEKLKREMNSLKSCSDYVDSGVQVSELDEVDLCEVEVQNSSSRKLQNVEECRQCASVNSIQETKVKYLREIEKLTKEKEKLLKELNDKKQSFSSSSAFGGGNGKFRNLHLEQRCQSLMMTLRQQQKQTEDILKNTWRQHKAEVNDLKSVLKMTEEKLKRQTKLIQEQLNKLAKTDLLVKDLFVENAYLLSSVQELEKQRHSSGKV